MLLNAARLALQDRPEGPVSAADFERALEMEAEGEREARRGRIGFARSSG